MDKEAYNLTAEGLRDFLKIGARETARIVQERDFLLKFAMAVEILPRLERAGVVKFPLGTEMHKKASKMAEKSYDELQKLAFLAKHAPMGIVEQAHEIEGGVKVTSADGIGAFTQEFLGLMGT